MSHKKRIGVLRGGPSAEYEVSLKSGAAVLSALRSKLDHLYEARDVLIDLAGKWHIDGREFSPAEAHHHFDIALNALHGAYGEDGKIQAILEAHDIPFTGSGSLSSAVAMNKILTKQALEKHGVRSPYWKEVFSEDVHIDPDAAAMELFRTFVMPAIVKPAGSGSSVGVSVARTHADLVKALEEAAKHGHSILIEEFIPGVEATCGVIEGFRGQELYALPPIEIRTKNPFFDYAAKYQGESEEIVPATFSAEIKHELEELAKNVHRLLGLKHYSRTDFIIHPRRGIYVLETNTLPGLTEESLLPKALRAVGSDLHEFIDHIIRLAID